MATTREIMERKERKGLNEQKSFFDVDDNAIRSFDKGLDEAQRLRIAAGIPIDRMAREFLIGIQ